MQKDVKIKRDVKLYITKSYAMEVFLRHSMFNPLTAFSTNWFRTPDFDTLIMSLLVIFKRPSDQQSDGQIPKLASDK